MKEKGIFLSGLLMFGRLLMYTVMCLIVSITVMALLPGKLGNLIAQAFDLGIILMLPYLVIWKTGDVDRNKFNYGHIKRDNWKGFKIGLIAAAPWMVCAVLLLLARAGAISEGYLPIYRLINAPFLPLCQALLPATLTLAEQNVFSVLAVALTSLVPPVVLGLGYRLGFARVSASEQVIYGGVPQKKRS